MKIGSVPILELGRRRINPRTVFLGSLFGLMAYVSLRVLLRLGELEPAGFDFCSFWAGARVAIQHPARLYDLAYVTNQQAWLIGQMKVHPFINPPSSLPLFLAFACLPFWPAYGLWVALTAALFLVASLRIGANWWVLLLPPVACVAQDGQVTLLIAALITGGLALRPRPILAGVLFGLAAAIKPQFLILAPLALVAYRQWRTIAMAGVTAGLLAVLTAAVWGPGVWADWLRALPGFQHAMFADPGEIRTMVTPYAALALAGLPGALAFLLIPPVLLAVWSTFRRTTDTPTRMLALVGGTLLIIPYAVNYEMALLVPAVTALAARTEDRRWPAYAAAVPVLGMAYAYGLWSLILLLALLSWARWPSLSRQSETGAAQAA